jgi:hypothetical protein
MLCLLLRLWCGVADGVMVMQEVEAVPVPDLQTMTNTLKRNPKTRELNLLPARLHLPNASMSPVPPAADRVRVCWVLPV